MFCIPESQPKQRFGSNDWVIAFVRGIPIIVLGGGGHAKAVIGILKTMPSFRILGYTAPSDSGPILDICHLGGDGELAGLVTVHRDLCAALGIGQLAIGKRRMGLMTAAGGFGLKFPPIVSPNALIAEEVAIGAGATIMHMSVVNSGTSIGAGDILNTNCVVEHDCSIGDFVHVAPGATLCGGVRIGSGSMIGAGATVIEGIRIAENCLIGAGATVVRDVNEPGVYVGCPAHRIR